jgi:trk system potassium uptake protein TrkA
MKATILGCGRVGSMIAGLLDQEKFEVTVIDNNFNAFGNLGDNFNGSQVTGNITDEEVLRSAGVETADLVVVLTSDDIANLMAAQMIRQKFNKDTILVRVRDPIKAGAFQEMGLKTICPTNVEFDMILKELKIKPRKGKVGSG